MDVLFLLSILQLYPGLKKSFEQNSLRNNLDLSACFCWDSRVSLREMDQKLPLVEPVVMGVVLGVLFRQFKVLDFMQY